MNNVCACAISHDNKAKFFRRERDLWFVSRFKKTHCQQQWSKGVLFLHSTSTVLAFASQTIMWIRTSWILIFWERNLYGGPQLSHQNQMFTANYKALTSNSNRSHQIQIAHSKFKLLTANYKSLTANSNRPQQIQIVHSKLKSLTANSNCSHQITNY